FQLPIRGNTRVESLTRQENGRYLLVAGERRFEADQVIVAMANYQKPRLPEAASSLDPSVVQLHSAAYKRPEQLQPGSVLVAGARSSGAEIALELAKSGRKVWVAGRPTGDAPVRMDSFFGRLLGSWLLLRVMFHRVLTIKTPMGKKARPKILKHAT